MTCQQVVEKITDYLEDALPERQRRQWEGHVAECAGCAHYLDQMRTTIRLVGELAITTPLSEDR